MIYYNKKSYGCIMFGGCGAFRAVFTQHIFHRALLISACLALSTYCVRSMDDKFGFLELILPDQYVYTTFTSAIGFMMVFRTSQAYGRFAEGCTIMHVMQADFLDAASLLISLSRASKDSAAELSDFRRCVVRLISCLNALCLAELGQVEADTMSHLRNSGTLDVAGLDSNSLQLIESSPCKPEAAFMLLQMLVTDSISDGCLRAIPPPLLTRFFQELGAGMLKFHEASKLTHVPFPFPFVTVIELLLIVHWIYTPFQMSVLAEGPFSAALFSALQSFFLWTLYGLASELDDPFGTDVNDLDLLGMQKSLNLRLVSILLNSTATTPTLRGDAMDERDLVDEFTVKGHDSEDEHESPSRMSTTLKRMLSTDDCRVTTNHHKTNKSFGRARTASMVNENIDLTQLGIKIDDDIQSEHSGIDASPVPSSRPASEGGARDYGFDADTIDTGCEHRSTSWDSGEARAAHPHASQQLKNPGDSLDDVNYNWDYSPEQPRYNARPLHDMSVSEKPSIGALTI